MKSINLTAYKTEYGIWAFDHEHQNTKNEALCNGTELVLDDYYKILSKKDPNPMDKMDIFVCTEDFKDSDTVLDFKRSENGGSVYLDMVLFLEVWLCPWIQSYFEEVPTRLYVKMNPVNIALENIQRNYAHPYKKFKSQKTIDEEKSTEEYMTMCENWEPTDKELEDWLNGVRL